MLTYSLLAGLQFGLFFTLVGLGFNLVFGVMRIVNLAHGDFVVLGALIASGLYAAYHVNPLVAAAIALVLFVVLGFPLYYLLVPRLLKSADPEVMSIILFFGASQIIEALETFAAGPTEHTIPAQALGSHPLKLLGQPFPASWGVSALVSLLCVALLFLYLYRTGVGRLTRAVMADRDEALATGIRVGRVSGLAFGIGLGLAAVAGALAPFMLGGILPADGVQLTILSFVVVIIGSLGSPMGTMLGGIVYGVSLSFMQTYFSSWSNILPYVLLILILLVRPSGLLGRKVRHA